MSRRGRLRGLEARLEVRSAGEKAARRRAWIACYASMAEGRQDDESEWDAAVRGYAEAWLTRQPFDREDAERKFREALDDPWLHGEVLAPHPNSVRMFFFFLGV